MVEASGWVLPIATPCACDVYEAKSSANVQKKEGCWNGKRWNIER